MKPVPHLTGETANVARSNLAHSRRRAETLTRTPLFEETVPVTFALDDVDLDLLRRRFAGLFDRAAHAVQLTGDEQDDAVIERHLVCRVAGAEPFRVSAEFLATRAALVRHVVDAVGTRTKRSLQPNEIQIEGLGVVAVRESIA